MDKITGMTKTCPVCKKDFYILDVGIWAYKYEINYLPEAIQPFDIVTIE